jgi:hypothetical protein
MGVRVPRWAPLVISIQGSSMKLVFVISFLFLTLAQAEIPSTPKLFFEYSWLYDSNCSNTPKRKIDPAWAQEAKDRTPDFIKIWNQSGPVLFGKVFEIFGLGFQRKEITATLSVCPAPSYSNPLVLNVTRFLKSYMGSTPPRSDDSFADLVFHEMLHTWIVENLDWPTPLITKYKNEERVVRNHLHLMAMQSYVYTELKRDDLLLMIDRQYSNMPDPGYNRAWEIVSKIEGYEAFISEIKRK